ncbi:hypothetical protein KKG56_05670 [bacterium]|nr:hypothetical protein [bacterium]
MMKNKNFDCVKMTREIRNKLYEENKGKGLKEYANILVKEAHKSLLWNRTERTEQNRNSFDNPIGLKQLEKKY